MTNFILTLAALFAPIVRLLGGDYDQFRAILETKLTLDGRRPMVGFANKQSKTSGNAAFIGAMFFYGMTGLFVAFALTQARSPLVGGTIVNTMFLIMLGMTLVADFANILLDTTDNAILQSRPVSGRTIYLARTAHICSYLGLLTFSMGLPAALVGTYTYHRYFALVFFPTLVGTIVVAVAGASLFYLLILRLTNMERVRDIVLYIQILFTFIIFGGYQFLPRLMDMANLRSFRIDHRWWIYVFPPAWMAGPLDLLCGVTGRPQYTLTLLAIVVPILALVIVTRVLAPRFPQLLAKMEIATERQAGPVAPVTTRSRPSRLAALVNRDQNERATFEFIWSIMGRDRQFKARVYPSLAMLAIMPLGMLASQPGGFKVALQNLPQTKGYFFMLYLACFSFPTAIMQWRYSNHWQAAWLFEALPFRRPGDVLVPALRVLMLRFIFPGFAAIAAALFAIWGTQILFDLVLATLVMILVTLVEALLLGRHLPFSQQFGVRESSGRMGKTVLAMLVPGLLGGIHFGLKHIPLGVPIACIPVVAAIPLLSRAYRNTTWDQVLSEAPAEPA